MNKKERYIKFVKWDNINPFALIAKVFALCMTGVTVLVLIIQEIQKGVGFTFLLGILTIIWIGYGFLRSMDRHIYFEKVKK